MANPFDATGIDMGDGIASPKPTKTNLGGWSASRNLAQGPDRCPTLGAGLTMASPFPEPCACGPIAPDTRQVCWSQTAGNNPHSAAPYMADRTANVVALAGVSSGASSPCLRLCSVVR